MSRRTKVYVSIIVVLFSPFMIFMIVKIVNICKIRSTPIQLIIGWNTEVYYNYLEEEEKFIDSNLETKLTDIDKILESFESFYDPWNRNVIIKKVTNKENTLIAIIIMSAGKNAQLTSDIFKDDNFGVVFILEKRENNKYCLIHTYKFHSERELSYKCNWLKKQIQE